MASIIEMENNRDGDNDNGESGACDNMDTDNTTANADTAAGHPKLSLTTSYSLTHSLLFHQIIVITVISVDGRTIMTWSMMTHRSQRRQ